MNNDKITESPPSYALNINSLKGWTAAMKIVENEIDGREGFSELYNKMEDNDRYELIKSIADTIKATLDFYES